MLPHHVVHPGERAAQGIGAAGEPADCIVTVGRSLARSAALGGLIEGIYHGGEAVAQPEPHVRDLGEIGYHEITPAHFFLPCCIEERCVR